MRCLVVVILAISALVDTKQQQVGIALQQNSKIDSVLVGKDPGLGDTAEDAPLSVDSFAMELTRGRSEKTELQRQMFFLLAGWILGILSSIIVEWIKKYLDRMEARKAIRIELSEVKTRLTANVFQIELGFGTYDRDLLKWLQPNAKEFTEIHPKENILALIDEQLSWPSGQIALYAKGKRKPPGTSLKCREIGVPFLESRIGNLSMFDANQQRLLLEIRFQISVINDDVKRARRYHELTFGSGVADSNMRIVNSNLDSTHLDISRVSRKVVDRINEFLHSNS